MHSSYATAIHGPAHDFVQIVSPEAPPPRRAAHSSTATPHSATAGHHAAVNPACDFLQFICPEAPPPGRTTHSSNMATDHAAVNREPARDTLQFVSPEAPPRRRSAAGYPTSYSKANGAESFTKDEAVATNYAAVSHDPARDFREFVWPEAPPPRRTAHSSTTTAGHHAPGYAAPDYGQGPEQGP
jgi:hypothetical protein